MLDVQQQPNWPGHNGAASGAAAHDAPAWTKAASERAGDTQTLHQDPMTGPVRLMLCCEYTGGERHTNAPLRPPSLHRDV